CQQFTAERAAERSADSMNITYRQNGDYLIPNIIIRKTKPIGHYGRLRKAYLEMHRPILFKIRLAKSAVVSDGLGLADNDVRDKIIAVLPVSDIHAICAPFCGSLCGKLLTGTNTPFAMSSARMAAFLASISAFFLPLILSSYRFCAPLAFRFK